MSFDSSFIGKTDLQPGQWVEFLPPDNKEDADSGRSLPAGHYKVISREDLRTMLGNDECRCWLMDVNGKFFDYCPRMGYLTGMELKDRPSYLPFNVKVKVISDEEMKEKVAEGDKGKVDAVNKIALATIKDKTVDPALKKLEFLAVWHNKIK